MDPKTLESLLGSRLPSDLAKELVSDFLQIRHDVASRTLGRSSPGKFAESVVQALQHLERGNFDKQPVVDDYLKNLESRSTSLPDGLRICAGRITRAMYTLRNRRNILHKGDVDPNEYDLRFLVASAQWVMAEFVREFSGSTMQQAGMLIAQVQAPVGTLVEDFGNKRIVHGRLSAKEEILVLLHSYHPQEITIAVIVANLDRRDAGAVKKALRELWRTKRVEGSASAGYRLTSAGLQDALEVIRRAAA